MTTEVLYILRLHFESLEAIKGELGMAEIKSCENCGWNGTWKDGNSCPFYTVKMCNTERPRMWINQVTEPDFIPEFSSECFNEYVAPKVMTNMEAAAILSSMLDSISYVAFPRGNGKSLFRIRYEAMCKAIKVLEETPD